MQVTGYFSNSQCLVSKTAVRNILTAHGGRYLQNMVGRYSEAAGKAAAFRYCRCSALIHDHIVQIIGHMIHRISPISAVVQQRRPEASGNGIHTGRAGMQGIVRHIELKILIRFDAAIVV